MILDALAFLGISNDAHLPAAIGGLFSFMGVLFTGLAAILVWISKQALLRAEKRLELRHALRAELQVQWLALYLSPRSADLLESIREKMLAIGGESYTPYFSRFLKPTIFGEVKSQLTALGREEIPSVVKFYHHLAVLDGFVEELRAEAFSGFAIDRKMEMISHLFLMIDRATEFAEDALSTLDKLLRVPKQDRVSEIKKALVTQNED